MEQPKRKKLGAEKLHAKRRISLHAAKCAKITDLFAGGAAVASTSSVTVMIQQQQIEGEDSSSGQERSSQRCRLTDRDSVVQPVNTGTVR